MPMNIIKYSNSPAVALSVSFGFGLVGLLVIFALTIQADPWSNTIALIFPFNYPSQQSFSAVIDANGIPINFGASDNILIARFSINNVDKILENTGALMALNPSIPGICKPLS